MKKLILVATLISHGQINAQCVKIYVKEHLSGDPICQLSNGDYLELCLDDKEVNGCPRNLYIYDMGFSAGSQTYELSLDKGWRTHYMTLMVNTTTKRFGFILQGQTALYSYYTENEMKDREEQENKQRQAQEVLYRKSDQAKYSIIDDALAAGNVELFKKSIKSLHYPRSYPNYKAYEKMEEARKQKEDIILLNKIDSLIFRLNTNIFKGIEGNIGAESLQEDEKITNEIINLYRGLNFQSQETKLEIASKVKGKFSGDFVYVEDAWQNKKIRDVLSRAIKALDRGTSGVHELFIKQNGEVLIDDVLIENCFAEPWSYTMSEDSDFEIKLGIKSRFYISDPNYKKVYYRDWYGLPGERKITNFKRHFEIQGYYIIGGFQFTLEKDKKDTIRDVDIITMCSYIASGDIKNSIIPHSGEFHFKQNYDSYRNGLFVGIRKRTANKAVVEVVSLGHRNINEYVKKYGPITEFVYPVVLEDNNFSRKHRVYLFGDLWYDN